MNNLIKELLKSIFGEVRQSKVFKHSKVKLDRKNGRGVDWKKYKITNGALSRRIARNRATRRLTLVRE